MDDDTYINTGSHLHNFEFIINVKSVPFLLPIMMDSDSIHNISELYI